MLRTATVMMASATIIALALTTALPSVHAESSVSAVAALARTTLNGAARQRMLTQRMVKAWCLIGLDNRNSNARAQLFETIEKFEAQLSELDVLAQGNAALAASIQRVKTLWVPFEALISGPVSRTAVVELLRHDKQLVEASEQVVQHIVALTATPYSRFVDLAGRQRMLSQRLLKTYMLLAWDIRDPAVNAEFIASWSAFEEALATLHAFTDNTPRLRAALAESDEQWRWLKSAISLSDERQYFPDIVDDAGEKILHNLDSVTQLYAQMLNAHGAR